MKVLLASFLLLVSAASAYALDDAPRPGPKDPAIKESTGSGSSVSIVTGSSSPGGIQEDFILPSANIGCIYTPEGGMDIYQPADGGPELACDRVEPTYVRITLGASGPASVDTNVGDPSCCSANLVLDYGSVWRAGPFSCRSTQKGLACERRDGHSMFLSRSRIAAD